MGRAYKTELRGTSGANQSRVKENGENEVQRSRLSRSDQSGERIVAWRDKSISA